MAGKRKSKESVLSTQLDDLKNHTTRTKEQFSNIFFLTLFEEIMSYLKFHKLLGSISYTEIIIGLEKKKKKKKKKKT